MTYGNGFVKIDSDVCVVCHTKIRGSKQTDDGIFVRKKHVFMNKTHGIIETVHNYCKPKFLDKLKREE